MLLAIYDTHVDQVGQAGQIADWEIIQQTATWLAQHADDPHWPWLRKESSSIATLLEGVLQRYPQTLSHLKNTREERTP